MSKQVKGVLFSVILIIICLILLPLVLDSVGDALATTGISSYAGVESLLGLIPLLVVVGVIIVAIINGFWALTGRGAYKD